MTGLKNIMDRYFNEFSFDNNFFFVVSSVGDGGFGWKVELSVIDYLISCVCLVRRKAEMSKCPCKLASAERLSGDKWRLANKFWRFLNICFM